MNEKHLEIKWTVSKARDSHGYNICTVWDKTTRYSTCGGGYDMLGTVFGDWLWSNYKDKIEATLEPLVWGEPRHEKGLYGYMSVKCEAEKGYLDGACGLDCMLKIAEAIGIDARPIYSARSSCYIGFYIKEKIAP